MKKVLFGLIVFICVLFINTSINAHSGRTDSSGGHNCSLMSQQKGLCSGYHYHNRNLNLNKKNFTN